MFDGFDGMLMYVLVFFFFKQKTAYEMRISDWSSDVCSSDLPRRGRAAAERNHLPQALLSDLRRSSVDEEFDPVEVHLSEPFASAPCNQIGTASRKERVCQYVSISVVAVSLKNTTTHTNATHIVFTPSQHHCC